tara:strand:+ start:20896 stop:22401 length:1506 start_codon:yes stop_codon:yes gene_type:complete
MLKYLFLFITSLFYCLSSFTQDTLKVNVYFNVNDSVATADEMKKVDNLLQNTSSLNKVILAGHTDSDGSMDYNRELSHRRVLNVKNAIESSVNVEIEINYFGESSPITSNLSSAGKQKNRRVELLFIYDPFKNSREHKNNLTIDEVYSELEANEQVFSIRNDEDTILVLEEGTVFIFDKNTFDSTEEKVLFKVKEVYSYADMIGERLTTTSNGHRLKTGGMLKTEALNESGKSIQPNKPITVLMPTMDRSESMKLFYGEKDASDNMNWELAKDELHTGDVSSDMVYIPDSRLRIIDSNNALIPPPRKTFRNRFDGFLEWLGAAFTFQGDRRGFPNDPYLEGYNGKSLKELMDSLGVDNYEDLRAKISEDRIKKGKANSTDLGYYGFNSAKLGWVNCDEFTNRNDLITMKTGLTETDIYTSLVFKKEKCIFPSSNYPQPNVFRNVPKNAPVYHVVMKTKEDKVLLSIVETTVGEAAPPAAFEEVELKDLKPRLAKLDGIEVE